MLVYHFLNEEFGLKDLAERRLKISRIKDLNDPFEFLGVDVRDSHLRFLLNETKSALNKSRGLICFSRNWSSPAMWAHYADRHRGICLGFEVPSSHLTKVRYVKVRPSEPKVIDEAFTKKLICTKFEHWKYESEYRLFTGLEHTDGVHYYAPFCEKLVLRQVYVGYASDISRRKLDEALGFQRSQVDKFKVRPGFRRFELVENKEVSAWT